MKRISICLLLSLIVLLSACSTIDDLDLVEADEATTEEATQFVTEYKHALVESINERSFRFVEPYLIRNTSLYHSLRRYVEDMAGQVTKEIILFDVEQVLVDEWDGIYVDVHEIVAFESSVGTEEIERRVQFLVTTHQDSLRVENIIVHETTEE